MKARHGSTGTTMEKCQQVRFSGRHQICETIALTRRLGWPPTRGCVRELQLLRELERAPRQPPLL